MHISRKVKVAVGAAIACVAISGAAFAYFTTTGAGTGSGAAGTSTAFVLHGEVTDLLYPGTSSSVTFTADNSATSNQYLTTIHLVSVSTNAIGCAGADFTMSDIAVGEDIVPGLASPVAATGTITMANTAVNQDACKNAVLTLTLTSS